jgi:putative peptide zinc metalloprotease protein
MTVPPATQASDVPVRADGVQLIGEMKGSGYRTPPALARRSDGQTIQLTPLLHLVLTEIDGRRSFDEVGAAVSAAYGKRVTGANVLTLIEDRLRPAGLVSAADGSTPDASRSNPLLALRFKYAVTDPHLTRRLTAPFALLFHPLLVVPVLVALCLVSWWVLFRKGLASATYEAFDKPGLLLLVVGVTILSAGFHEFGHAAAARRGGATPGAMGVGLYLVWPAFYTDVTDSYRLGRWGRVVTDLGGLYFNAIVAVAIAGVWWVTQYDALLLVIATQILQMVRQLTPLVRFDGYHVLADVTGVPDLFHRIKPTLLGLLPWRWRHPEVTVLKPWARAVVSLWVLVVVPMLAFSIFVMVVSLPRVLGTAWASAGRQSTFLGRAWSDADVLEVMARAIAVLAVVFPILATALLLVRLGRHIVTRTWTATRGRPLRRGLAALVALALVGGLAYAWWPREGAYRPILPFEGGTVTQAVAATRPAPAGLRAGSYGRIVTGWDQGERRPTRTHPQLALVLVPRGGTEAMSSATGHGGATTRSWVFPFDKPLEPGTGDNQALAVNTTDDTVQYDVAFALVWVEDDSPALNTNEAYAFASCSHCAAVSVGFQVVLVTGHNHVAVPQNISAAVNYDCVNCLTYALATQLFVTLDGPLSDASAKQLDALWQEIAEFGAHITSVPLEEIRGRLSAYEQQILDVVGADQPRNPGGSVQTGGNVDQPTPGQSPSVAATDKVDTGSPSDGSAGADSETDSGTDGAVGTESGSSSATSDATPDPGSTADSGAGDGSQPTPTDQPTPAADASTNP